LSCIVQGGDGRVVLHDAVIGAVRVAHLIAAGQQPREA
jgi:hypothetical protein